MLPFGRGWFGLAAACGLLLVVTLWCGAAMAQAEQPSEADRATARRLMDIGDQKSKQGDLKAALEAYQGADAIMKVPTTGLEVGKLQRSLGLLVQAADTFSRVRRYKHPEGEPEPDAFAQARAEAAKLATAVDEAIPEVTLAFTGLPAGTKPQVKIDGEPLPAAVVGLPRRVNPGAHKLAATVEGYQPIEQSFKLVEKQRLTLTLPFEPVTEAVPPAPKTKPSEPRPETPPDAPPAAGWSTQRTLALVSAGVGVAGLVVGGVLGARTASAWDEALTHCDQSTPRRCDAGGVSLVDDAKVSGTVSTIAVIVGGVGLAGAAALWLTAGSASEPSAASWIVPLVGPDGVGLGARGVF